MTDLIDLHRTFSPAKELEDEQDELLQYLNRDKEKLTWPKLYENAVTVVVGEAGIGKTSEFKNATGRLQKQGKAAFFVELNQLTSNENWQRIIKQNDADYIAWSNSSNIGYFFLDAIDESCLISHAAFKNSLSIVSDHLKQNSIRIKIIVSSRWTDWGQKEVQKAVSELLVKPINQQAEPFVVLLDPLSEAEAKRFAKKINVKNGAEFWQAITHGNYWHMATRPLDLEWLVALWNTQERLGKYLELIEGNVTNRLKETNPNYKTADKMLSPEKLRCGAEELAAATEFSGRHHIATVSVPKDNEVVPSAVLTNWSEPEVMRLLASAIFDEATYGRVKFHHRSVREYLAACWVKRQVDIGLPIQQAINLFAAAPFGELMLIPSRRWALCWLAGIDVKVREWVTDKFPEMIAFDGDPESWDELSVDRAFTAYLQRLKNGLRTDWHNDVSEYRRVGRRLSAGKIASLLAEPNSSERIRVTLFFYAKFARLHDCAEVAFSIYQDAEKPYGERGWALAILEEVGTKEQRSVISNDLLSGKLATNELIAAALPVIGWQSLTVEQLAGIFKITEKEDHDGLGPMAQCVQYSLLPATNDINSAELLLNAIIAVLPQPALEKRFDRIAEESTWATNVLPHCYERLLELFAKDSTQYPQVCIDAAEHIEALRNTYTYQQNAFKKLPDIIAQHYNLRWKIAVKLPDSRNNWNKQCDCIVTFDWDDLSELTKRANDLDLGLTESERTIWFKLAFNVAFYTPAELRKSSRTKAVQALADGPEQIVRQEYIEKCRAQSITFQQRKRNRRSKERRKKREERQKNKEMLLADIKHIHDGSNRELLEWLLGYSFSRSRQHSGSRIDFELIKNDFGRDIADALTAGLKMYWRAVSITNPENSSYSHYSYLLTALATELENNFDTISFFSSKEAAQAACIIASCARQNSVTWFDRLTEVHESAVCEALRPWIDKEATSVNQAFPTIDFVLHCSPQVRVKLLTPIISLIKNGEIQNVDLLLNLVKTLREDDLLSQQKIADLYKAQVMLLNDDELIADIRWLYLWLETDTVAAWNWFEKHLKQIGKKANKQFEDFAKASRYEFPNWIRMQPDKIEHANDVLVGLFNRLNEHISSAKEAGENKKTEPFEPVPELRNHIVNMLVQMPGRVAHDILTKLSEEKANQEIRDWLLAERTKHAAHTAQEAAVIEPAKLRNIGSVFQADPQSEAQLFQQVLARLEEIKKGVEEGPFSERCLFWPRISEKNLQHWLAARLRDTQNRRFSVHREEEVDNDKKTDIQVSCKQGNVCIEIKPIEKITTRRKYTAKFLTEDTLYSQIVGRYLKGYNSQHGILVLFRLDEKTWDIPGGARRQSFAVLVDYLQLQADRIKAEASSANVEALHVIGIDCVAPKKTSLSGKKI